MYRKTVQVSRVVLVAFTLVALSGCIGGSGSGGGRYSSSAPNPVIGPRIDPPPAPEAPKVAAYEGIRLDAIIPVFEPGLPEDPDDYAKEGVWPELRRTEAVRFALALREQLQSTRAFGAVYVTADATAAGELYILGEIVESNGEDVEIRVRVVDAAGNRWMRKNYSHRVKEDFWRNPRTRGGDPYQPVFNQAARDIAELMKKRPGEDLAKLRDIAQLRFAREFSEDAFGDYIYEKDGRYSLLALPSKEDPMLERTRTIRVQEGLFLDNLQEHYATFAQKTDTSYASWQEYSLIEGKAHRETRRKAVWQGVLGAAITLGGIYTAAKGSSSGNAGSETLGVGATIAGGLLIAQSFKNSAQGKAHAATLSELGQSLDVEVSPQVVELENTTVELTGNAREQFRQWRDALKQVYDLEKVPDKAL